MEVMSEPNGILFVRPPEKWARSPEWMSFSFARDAEMGPRRASLRRSDYPYIWNRSGYPAVFSTSATSGIIVHSAVRTVISHLSEAGCSSMDEPRAFHAMKELGGYTKVVTAALENWLECCESNPRLAPRKPMLEQRLRAQLAGMRLAVQKIVSRSRWSKTPGRSRGAAVK